jgi:hypothetical protein
MTKFAGVAGVAGDTSQPTRDARLLKTIGSVFLIHFPRTASRKPPPDPRNPRRHECPSDMSEFKVLEGEIIYLISQHTNEAAAFRAADPWDQ